MKIVIDTPERIAELAAAQYADLLERKPDAILGFATGSTPLGLYGKLAELCSNGRLSFAKASSFNLDEYVGLDGTHPQSYRYFMNENLFCKIDIDLAKTKVPNGLLDEGRQNSFGAYDREIEKAGGVDLQLLGIGNNGHIGFNEPNTPFGSETHIVELTQSTREANKRFFDSIDEVPTHAVTMGIKTVMHSKGIILIALGKAKSAIMQKALEGEVCEAVPASVLQLHPNLTVYMDHDAASLLGYRGYCNV